MLRNRILRRSYPLGTWGTSDRFRGPGSEICLEESIVPMDFRQLRHSVRLLWKELNHRIYSAD